MFLAHAAVPSCLRDADQLQETMFPVRRQVTGGRDTGDGATIAGAGAASSIASAVVRAASSWARQFDISVGSRTRSETRAFLIVFGVLRRKPLLPRHAATEQHRGNQ